MVFNACCFCVDLRVGAIAIAVSQIVGAIVCIACLPISEVVVPSVFGAIVSGCLLFGAIKCHQTTIKISLVLSMISILAYGIAGIFLVVATGHDAIGTAFRAVGAIFIIGALINVYFWLCVYSFLKDLKSGASQADLLSN